MAQSIELADLSVQVTDHPTSWDKNELAWVGHYNSLITWRDAMYNCVLLLITGRYVISTANNNLHI